MDPVQVLRQLADDIAAGRVTALSVTRSADQLVVKLAPPQVSLSGGVRGAGAGNK
jgi:hypothetical protein